MPILDSRKMLIVSILEEITPTTVVQMKNNKKHEFSLIYRDHE